MSESVTDYTAALPQTRRERFRSLHDLIVALYPDAVIDMRYRMATYQRGEGWVALANQPHNISLYTCGYHHIETFKTRHPGIRTGKGCINFTDKDGIPLRDVPSVVNHAIERPEGR